MNKLSWKRETGQSVVEFALVVPLLLLLLIGIAEFGRAWMARNIMTGAAREGVRIFAVQAGGYDNAIARAKEVLASAGIPSPPAVVTGIDNGSYGNCTITINYDFPLVLIGFIPGLDNLALSATSSMRREY